LSRRLLLLLAAVILLRAPFLDQPVQGDDIYYLAGAQHAQIDPLHPTHTRYVFLGDLVDMRGHPHPPLNAWILGVLLFLFDDVNEVAFHTAYVVFSLIAVGAMWALARRFSPKPVWATLLFMAVPAFVINGNSFESDTPFLAFWMAGVALVVLDRPAWLAAAALAAAALTAFQAIFLTPILCVHAWLYRRNSPRAWLLAFVPPLVIGGWQLWEWTSSGSLPAAVLGGHLTKYGFQAIQNKINNALALSVHALWMIFPLVWIPAAARIGKERNRDILFLVAWTGLFFAGAIVVFFAGSARYLLPMAAPLALLASRAPVRWLAAGFAIQFCISIGLAIVNKQHWTAYREFAESLKPQADGHRVWINGEWGLRFYLEEIGGLAMRSGQAVRPGDIIVSSALGYPANFTTGGGTLTRLVEREIRPRIPLRIIALDTRSAYSTVKNGFWPFDISTGPIDLVRAGLLVERQPTLQYVPMNSPEAEQHLVSGVESLEEGRYRWMGSRAVLVVKSPPAARPVSASIFIPQQAAARTITLAVDNYEVASKSVNAPGAYVIESGPIMPAAKTATITITVDKTFHAPNDRRELGAVLSGAGFR
jgi:hypothetical protein